MTTNLNAIAGPSRLSPSPKYEDPPRSPTSTVKNEGGGGAKSGISVDEDGEVVKVPAFLNKLFRCVRCDLLPQAIPAL